MNEQPIDMRLADEESLQPISREHVAESLGLPTTASWKDIKMMVDEQAGKDESSQEVKQMPDEYPN